jgi:hypothetical protein
MQLDLKKRLQIVEATGHILALVEQSFVDILEQLEAHAEKARLRINALAPPAELDAPAAAAQLSMSESTLRRRVKNREIAYRRDGVRLLFTQASLDEYRERATVPAHAA